VAISGPIAIQRLVGSRIDNPGTGSAAAMQQVTILLAGPSAEAQYMRQPVTKLIDLHCRTDREECRATSSDLSSRDAGPRPLTGRAAVAQDLRWPWGRHASIGRSSGDLSQSRPSLVTAEVVASPATPERSFMTLNALVGPIPLSFNLPIVSNSISVLTSRNTRCVTRIWP